MLRLPIVCLLYAEAQNKFPFISASCEKYYETLNMFTTQANHFVFSHRKQMLCEGRSTEEGYEEFRDCFREFDTTFCY